MDKKEEADLLPTVGADGGQLPYNYYEPIIPYEEPQCNTPDIKFFSEIEAVSVDWLWYPMLIPNHKVYKKSSKNLHICVFAQIFCLHFKSGISISNFFYYNFKVTICQAKKEPRFCAVSTTKLKIFVSSPTIFSIFKGYKTKIS